jgi:hypothetical protein
LCEKNVAIANQGIPPQLQKVADMTIEFRSSDPLLTRDMTAVALTEAGYPIKSKTLATKASRGGGPPFQRFGSRPLYRWSDTIAWAENQMSEAVTSTSDFDIKTNQPSNSFSLSK